MSLNLDNLLIHLKDKVTEKWHQFGEALGVEKEILDRCLNYPPEQSIVEMLDHWLRSCDLEERNWRDVAKALRQIEHNPLAEEIKTIDKIGHDFAHYMWYSVQEYIYCITIILLPTEYVQDLMMFQIMCFRMHRQSQIQPSMSLHRQRISKILVTLNTFSMEISLGR